MKKLVYFRALMKLVAKNMWLGRNKGTLIGFVILWPIITVPHYIQVSSISTAMVVIGIFSSALLWFVGLPIIITIIDCKLNPDRINRLVMTIPEFYDDCKIRLK